LIIYHFYAVKSLISIIVIAFPFNNQTRQDGFKSWKLVNNVWTNWKYKLQFQKVPKNYRVVCSMVFGLNYVAILSELNMTDPYFFKSV